MRWRGRRRFYEPSAYGKQAMAARGRQREREERERKLEQRRREEAIAAPTGVHEFTARVESVQDVNTKYGWRWKMTVQAEDGWRAYGTIPASLLRQVERPDLLVWRTVRLKANLKPGSSPHVALMSRPRGTLADDPYRKKTR